MWPLSDAEAQLLLPQVLTVSERTMSAQIAASAMESLPLPRVFLRCKTAWVTADSMVQIAGDLGGRLAAFSTAHAFTVFDDS